MNSYIHLFSLLHTGTAGWRFLGSALVQTCAPKVASRAKGVWELDIPKGMRVMWMIVSAGWFFPSLLSRKAKGCIRMCWYPLEICCTLNPVIVNFLECSVPYVEYHLLTFYCVPPVGLPKYWSFQSLEWLGRADQSCSRWSLPAGCHFFVYWCIRVSHFLCVDVIWKRGGRIELIYHDTQIIAHLKYSYICMSFLACTYVKMYFETWEVHYKLKVKNHIGFFWSRCKRVYNTEFVHYLLRVWHYLYCFCRSFPAWAYWSW